MATEGISSMSESTQSYTSASSASSVSKEEFLRLLTYQLKSQNPLSPYDNQEFASQLAQFSQLEQLTDMKSLLEEQIQSNLLLTQTISNTALPGLLGKTAKSLTGSFSYNGDNQMNIGYSLPFAGKSGNITITDSAGAVVRNIELNGSELSSGYHAYEWDGLDNNGNSVAAGTYNIECNITDSNGSTVNADTYMTGKIESVKFKSEGTVLVVDGQEVALSDIEDIST